jgi:hypothetical protein
MITVNMTKAKEIAHNMRRQERAAEFAPLDIKVTIPAEADAAETARAAIRAKYEVMQTSIDLAADVAALKAALEAE